MKASPLRASRRGATAIEYGLMATLVGVAILGGILLLRDALQSSFENTSEVVDEAIGSGS